MIGHRSRRVACVAAVVGGLSGISLPAVAADMSAVEDHRQVVTLPPEVAAAFLTEMRDHMRTLDDIMIALADGAFDEAATIADLRLDFGHRLWDVLRDQGMTDAELLALKQALQETGHGPGRGQGRGMGSGGGGGGGGGGQGFGRFMPEAFRAMGGAFHEAGAALAETARAVPDQPTAADYAGVLDAVRSVTATCRACHDTFRVVATD